MISGVSRCNGSEPMKLCLELISRRTPAVIDTTPTSIGGITPACFRYASVTPLSRNDEPDTSPTPYGATPVFYQVGNVSRFSEYAALTSSPAFGFNARASQHVRFHDPPADCLLGNDACSGKDLVSPPHSEEHEDGKSSGDRSYSTCSFVGHLPSNDLSIKNTFIHMDSDDADSDDDVCIPMQKSLSLPNVFQLRRARATQIEYQIRPDSVPEDQPPSKPKPQGLPSVDEVRMQGLASAGSALHDTTGTCKPCAFFWKPEGCQNGIECYHCHACPEDEIRRRKKAKVDNQKKAKRLAKAAAVAKDLEGAAESPTGALLSDSGSPN